MLGSSPLRYVDEVIRCGSVRIAADRVNVAPSAISRLIRNIEEELGQQLFERHARGVKLTEAGRVFARYVREALLAQERVRLEIEDFKGLRRGHIRLRSVDGIVGGPLSDAISSFQKIYPGVTFRLDSTGTQEVIRAIREGEADIGVAFHALPESGVSMVTRIPDPLCAVVNPKHPLAKSKNLAFVDILPFPIALPEASFGIRNLVDSYCRTKRLNLVAALETNSIEALRGFARTGGGVTMLPSSSAKREAGLGLVRAIPFRDPSLRNVSLDICVQEGRALPAAAKEFSRHLHETLTS
jgi:DNA-binding transcriptional LysR family regulator